MFCLFQATFFLNGVNLDPRLGARYAQANLEALVAIVNDGHVLGDHSYNHMKVGSYSCALKFPAWF